MAENKEDKSNGSIINLIIFCLSIIYLYNWFTRHTVENNTVNTKSSNSSNKEIIAKHNCNMIFESFKHKNSPFIPIKWESKAHYDCTLSLKNTSFDMRIISILMRAIDESNATEDIFITPPSIEIQLGETFNVSVLGTVSEKKYKSISIDKVNTY